MNTTLASAGNLLLLPDVQQLLLGISNSSTLNNETSALAHHLNYTPATFLTTRNEVHSNTLQLGPKSLAVPKIHHDEAGSLALHQQETLLTKSPDGFYVFNNLTLKSCRDVLFPVGVDRCALIDYVEDCASDEGLIDYVAFFFCAFSPDKLPLALFISVSSPGVANQAASRMPVVPPPLPRPRN